MKIYISGPMTGRPDLNVKEFRRVEYKLKLEGHKVVVPHDIKPPKESMTYDDWMKADIAEMCTCDAVHMLHDWNMSPGAIKENLVAHMLNMPITIEEV